jgi:uncharacterized protein (TIGR02001 family)
MRTFLRNFGSLLALSAATPVLAQDSSPTPAVTINGSAMLVSDYRFRGISQTDKRFAVQGSLMATHQSGFYASAWGSSIDDYVAFGSDQEIDLTAGFKKSFGGTTVDVGVLYYYYPGGGQFGPVDTDFAESFVAVSRTFGPATGKVLAAYAPKQSALAYLPTGEREDNFYLAGDLTATIPDTGFGVSAHLGRSFSRSYLTSGQKYTDWSVGASYTWKAMTLAVQYVDTDNIAFISPSGRNVVKGGIVGTLGVAF